MPLATQDKQAILVTSAAVIGASLVIRMGEIAMQLTHLHCCTCIELGLTCVGDRSFKNNGSCMQYAPTLCDTSDAL
jgi:hypothetical protein